VVAILFTTVSIGAIQTNFIFIVTLNFPAAGLDIVKITNEAVGYRCGIKESQ